MDEKQMRVLLREFIKEYYEEDKRILIDISILKINCIVFLLYDLIFFGNKIILAKETFYAILKESKKKSYDKRSQIIIKNANYLIERIKKDEKGNYQIIKMKKSKGGKIQSVCNFLKQNEDAIYYLSDMHTYQKLRDNGLSKQLNFIEIGKSILDPFKDKNFKFETIGALKFENEKMLIYPKENPIIKVYNQKGKERTNAVQEVKIRDYVLIIGKKEDKVSYNLYQVVSRHTKHHAIRIIWTDLKKGQKTNKYIDRLPYQFRVMIQDNIQE